MSRSLQQPIEGFTETGGSIIIAAYNEESVIGRCLRSLAANGPVGLSVVVACNGCTDDTAAIARQTGIADVVLEIDQASKTNALNEAERLDPPFPRIYLDADIELTGAAARELVRVLSTGGVAGRPPVSYDTSGASWVVRSHYRVRGRTPELTSRLWGAGVYGLSSEARERFGEFPDVTGEDLWVDEMFDQRELVVVPTDPVVVQVPRTTRALFRVVRRAQRGRLEHSSASVRPDRDLQTTPSGTLRAVLRTARGGLGAAIDVVVYLAFSVSARLSARLAGPDTAWERDDTTRLPSPE